MSAEELEKNVQVEDTRRVIVTFKNGALREMIRREAGVPEGVPCEIEPLGDASQGCTVTWEVTLDG